MKNLLSQFWNNEDGVTAIEYALIGVAMAVVVGTVFGKGGDLRNAMSDAFGTITSQLKNGKS